MLDLQLFIRSLKRNKLFSTVNILGLTIGFFTALLIFLFVKGEFTYDQFHEKKERIYRVNQTFIWGEDNPNQFSATGLGVGFAIKQEIQEVEEVTRVFLLGDIGPIIFDSEGKQQIFTDEVVFGVEDSFLEVFDFDFHYGDPSSALSEPYSVVLKRETAERFFGQNDPLGKVLSMDNGDLYTVTGVLDDLGQNSHFDQASVLISLNSIPRIKSSDDNWMWTMFETFILLRPDADFAIVEEKIKKLPEQYVGTTLSWMGYTYEEYIAAGKKWDLFLHALPDLYLFSDNVYSRLAPTGNLRVVIALIGAAIFLLVLSCINFINLSTASFTARAKDVALRKVIGAPKLVLGFRFFKEALLYAVFSMVLAIVIASLTIPSINQQLDLFLSLDSVFSIEILLFLSLLLLLVSFVTGIYPFVFFNKFQPIKSLKGELKSGRKGLRIRNGMLITQYSVSFLLIISSLTLYDQLNFMLRADVGFKKNNLLVLENVNWLSSSQAFIDELSALTGIEKITHCDGVPMFITQGDQFTPNDPDAGSVPLNFARGDEHYLQALDLQLVMGRSFSESFQTDSTAVIINRTAAEAFGWPLDESIFTRKVKNWSGTYNVIGVVDDFHYWSINTPIEPFAIFSNEANVTGGKPLANVALRVMGSLEDLNKTKEKVEELWNKYANDQAIEIVALEDHIANSYELETRFGNVLSFFAILTIIVASLGLFGIVVFSLEQKVKEIGVRKVLGASSRHLIALFTKSYLILVVVSFVLAAPLGYFLMEKWLDDYIYRITLDPMVFVASLAILFLISALIAGIQTFRVSLLNPAEVLKDE